MAEIFNQVTAKQTYKSIGKEVLARACGIALMGIGFEMAAQGLTAKLERAIFVDFIIHDFNSDIESQIFYDFEKYAKVDLK